MRSFLGRKWKTVYKLGVTQLKVIQGSWPEASMASRRYAMRIGYRVQHCCSTRNLSEEPRPSSSRRLHRISDCLALRMHCTEAACCPSREEAAPARDTTTRLLTRQSGDTEALGQEAQAQVQLRRGCRSTLDEPYTPKIELSNPARERQAGSPWARLPTHTGPVRRLKLHNSHKCRRHYPLTPLMTTPWMK